MDLSKLPVVSSTPSSKFDIGECTNEGQHIVGVFFEENIDDGNLESEIFVGMDVCLYTNGINVKLGRPSTVNFEHNRIKS